MSRLTFIDEDYDKWTTPERINVHDVRRSPAISMTLAEIGKRTRRRPVKKHDKRRKCAQCKGSVSLYTPPVRIPKKDGGFHTRLLCHGCRVIKL